MSKKLEAMTEAYRLLLASIDVVPQSDDLLVQDIDDMKTQVLVDGKPLALPTDKIVNNYSDSMVVFHPLCENLLLGESPVLQELRDLIMESLNNLIVQTIDSILMIAVDDNFEDLTPNQVEFMRCTAGADNTTLKNWRSIARRIDARSSANRVVTIFLKRGAIFKGSKRKRVANVNFNLYNKLDQNSATVIGAKVRKADLKVYSAIFEALFKHIENDDDEYYSAGTDALIAPYFTVLVESYYKVLKDVNSVTWLLRKPIEKVSGRKLHVNDDFMGHLDNLQQYRDVLPVMPLNDGDRNVNREEEQNRNNLNNNTAPLPTNTVNNQQAITNMAQQANPYYDTPVVADVVVNTEPVQSPQFNQQMQQQPVPNQSNAFPSLEAQLNGVPLSGMPQGHGFMNPYAQPQMQMNPYAMQNPQMNPYAQQQQMNPYAQAQPQMNPYAQPQMQMNPYAQMQQQQMNPYNQMQQMNPYNQMQSNMGQPNGFKL